MHPLNINMHFYLILSKDSALFNKMQNNGKLPFCHSHQLLPLLKLLLLLLLPLLMIIVIACCMLIRTEIPSCCLMLLSLRSLYPFTTNFSFSACKQNETFSQNDITIFIQYMVMKIYDLSNSRCLIQFLFHVLTISLYFIACPHECL